MAQFFEWVSTQFYKTLIYDKRYMMYLEGLLDTIIISLGAIVLGLVIGILFATIKYINKRNGKLKVLTKTINFVIFIVRGTPVVLQLMIMYFIVLVFLSNGIVVAIITFGINSGAYVAEILRGGLEGVDDGQYEAGRALGLGMGKTMLKIIIPQAVKTCIPAFFNEFIALIKETSVVGYIAISDVTYAAYRIQSRTLDAYFPLIISALIYLVLVALLTFALRKIERRLAKNER
ncbi:MAG: amino acid ABC transporter permease [Clostridiales bacterium]|nr:amino acid ABC transporter permease [Clostridiales bacterium]